MHHMRLFSAIDVVPRALPVLVALSAPRGETTAVSAVLIGVIALLILLLPQRPFPPLSGTFDAASALFVIVSCVPLGWALVCPTAIAWIIGPLLPPFRASLGYLAFASLLVAVFLGREHGVGAAPWWVLAIAAVFAFAFSRSRAEVVSSLVWALVFLFYAHHPVALALGLACAAAIGLRDAIDSGSSWMLRHGYGPSYLYDMMFALLVIATAFAALACEPPAYALLHVVALPVLSFVTTSFVVFGSPIFKLPNRLCGNGILEPLEQCDDGNVFRGDGCSSTCNFEDTCGCDAGTQWLCTSTPMQQSQCCASLLNPVTLQRTCSCAGQASGSPFFTVTPECAKRDINECMANPCAANAMCFNNDGTAPGATSGHSCVCPPGLLGDGVTRCDVKVYESVTRYKLVNVELGDVDTAVTQQALLTSGVLPSSATADTVRLVAEYISAGAFGRRLLESPAERELLQQPVTSGVELTIVITSPDALGMLSTTTAWNVAATSNLLATLFNTTVQLTQQPTSVVQNVEQAGGAVNTVLSGFSVQSIVYNETSMAWVVRIRYQDTNAHTVSSPYISRAGPPPYDRATLDTFFVSRHPCMMDSTVCCLLDYRDEYIIGSFADNITAAVGSCDAGVQAQSTRGMFGTNANEYLVNHLLDDFPLSHVVRHSQSVVELHLNRFDLRNNFTTRQTLPTTGATEFELFVGMSYFTTLPAPALATVASQARITIVESDSMTLATSSERDYSFLQFMTVSVFQTKFIDDGFFVKYPQVVKVSFVLPADLMQNMRTGLIPLTSVRFAIDPMLPEMDDAVKWKNPCFSTDETGLYDAEIDGDANPLRELYAGAMAQDCSVPEPMCMNPSTASLTSRLVEFYFPIGDSAVSDTIMQSSQRHFLFVHFDLSVVDSAGRVSSTKLFAQAPITQLSINSYCETLEVARDLSEIADVSLVIGSVGADSEWDASIAEYENMLADASSLLQTEVDTQARSVQAGLISLIAHGTESVFATDFAQEFRLELDALTTLHFLDNTVYDEVSSSMIDGTAWTPERNAVSGHMDIKLSTAVEQTCASASLPGDISCAIRRAVQSREIIEPSAVHSLATGVGTRDLGLDREWLVQHSIRGDSTYSREFAQNFTSLLRARHNVNDRYRRAWFVNPGYPWTVAPGSDAQSALSLSDKMILIAIISLDDGQTQTRRRMLLESVDGGRTIRQRRLLQAPGADAIANAQRTVTAIEETPLRGTLPPIHNTQIDAMATVARALGVDTENELWRAVRVDINDWPGVGETRVQMRDAIQQRLRERSSEFAPTATRLFVAQYGLSPTASSRRRRALLQQQQQQSGYITLMIVFNTTSDTNRLYTEDLFNAIFALPGGDESYSVQSQLAQGLVMQQVRFLNQTVSFRQADLELFFTALDGWIGDQPRPRTPPPPPPSPRATPVSDDDFFRGSSGADARAIVNTAGFIVASATTLALAFARWQ